MHAHGAAPDVDLVLLAPFVFALILYFGAAVTAIRRNIAWPWNRCVSWCAGVCAAASGYAGPLADAAHDRFEAHMAAHLAVGMIAPVLLVLAAPVTLAFRVLHVVPARRIARFLGSRPIRVLSMPVVAGVLNIGGLWVLYLTPLVTIMMANQLVHLLVMTHILLVGVLFTAAVIPTDPTPHRAGFRTRLGVLVGAIAAHGILAKMIYAVPPAPVPIDEGRTAAMLMFTGGDVVDAALLVILCAQWYRQSGRQLARERLRVA